MRPLTINQEPPSSPLSSLLSPRQSTGHCYLSDSSTLIGGDLNVKCWVCPPPSHYCLYIIRSERQGWWPSVAALLLGHRLGFVVSVGQQWVWLANNKAAASPGGISGLVYHHYLAASQDWTIGLIKGLISSQHNPKFSVFHCS